MSRSNLKRIDRVAQMTKQEEIIAKKRQEILEKKKTVELGKAVAAAQVAVAGDSIPNKNTDSISSEQPSIITSFPGEKPKLQNFFCNDGSFLTHFKKILESTKKEIIDKTEEKVVEVSESAEPATAEKIIEEDAEKKVDIPQQVPNSPDALDTDPALSLPEHPILSSSNIPPPPPPPTSSINVPIGIPSPSLPNSPFPSQGPSGPFVANMISQHPVLPVPSHIISHSNMNYHPYFNPCIPPPNLPTSSIPHPSLTINNPCISPLNLPMPPMHHSNINNTPLGPLSNSHITPNSFGPQLIPPPPPPPSNPLYFLPPPDPPKLDNTLLNNEEDLNLRADNDFTPEDDDTDEDSDDEQDDNEQFLPTTLESLVELVAEKGDAYEEKIRSRKNDVHSSLWFLFDKSSERYINYREMVLAYRQPEQKEEEDDEQESQEEKSDEDDRKVQMHEQQQIQGIPKQQEEVKAEKEQPEEYNNTDSESNDGEKYDPEYNKHEFESNDEGKYDPEYNKHEFESNDEGKYDPEYTTKHEFESNEAGKYDPDYNTKHEFQSNDAGKYNPKYITKHKFESNSEEKYDPEYVKPEFEESNNEEKYDPESVCEYQDDSDDDYMKNMMGRNTDNLKRRHDFKDESDSGDEEQDRNNINRQKKRKSRWGGKVDSVSNTVTAVVQTNFANQNKPILSAIQRTDPALLLYAKQNYGTTNLTEDDWRKCEEHFKVNLLYQDMMRKRQEIDLLARSGKFKYEYDSDEDVTGGTWEHKLRTAEMEATRAWADALTEQSEGKHHIGDFLPPEELKKFMEKYDAQKCNRQPDLSDYKEYKLREDNIGFQMLQKLGWKEGQGLGADGSGIVEPVNKATQRESNQGLGAGQSAGPEDCDNEYEAYRKRMMLAYRFRPNPLNNPRRAYY